MRTHYQLKRLEVSHYHDVREVYADAIEHQIADFYTKEQIQSWSSLAWLPGFLDRSLVEGKGWISLKKEKVEAFAVRYPVERLALLYCRSRSSRQGHASALLDCVELEAMKEGQTYLVTEASLLSYPLLLRRGWILIGPETIQIAGVSFDRFRMQKTF